MLLERLADATIGTRRCSSLISPRQLLIIDDLGGRKLPGTAAEDLLELVTRATNARAHSSPRTHRSRIGPSSSAMRLPLSLCSLDSSIAARTQVRTAKLANGSSLVARERTAGKRVTTSTTRLPRENEIE